MSNFLEAFKNFEQTKKKHVVTIGKRQIEVTLEKKLEIQTHEDKYMMVGDNIVLKPRPKTHRTFPVIVDLKQDPYWIATDEGLEWQIESE